MHYVTGASQHKVKRQLTAGQRALPGTTTSATEGRASVSTFNGLLRDIFK